MGKFSIPVVPTVIVGVEASGALLSVNVAVIVTPSVARTISSG